MFKKFFKEWKAVSEQIPLDPVPLPKKKKLKHGLKYWKERCGDSEDHVRYLNMCMEEHDEEIQELEAKIRHKEGEIVELKKEIQKFKDDKAKVIYIKIEGDVNKDVVDRQIQSELTEMLDWRPYR